MSQRKKALLEISKPILLKKLGESGILSKSKLKRASVQYLKKQSILTKYSPLSTFRKNLESISLELKEILMSLTVLSGVIIENDKKMKTMQDMMAQFLAIFSTYNTALQCIATGEKYEPEQEN